MYFQFLLEDKSTEILINHIMEKVKETYPDKLIDFNVKSFKGIGHLSTRGSLQERKGSGLLNNINFSVKISIPLENTGVSSVFAASVWPFSSFFPLREEMRETFFRLSLQPYPAALRKFAWPLWWHGRKCSSWYLHQNVPAAPAHPWVLPREREGWSYMYAGNGELPICGIM